MTNTIGSSMLSVGIDATESKKGAGEVKQSLNSIAETAKKVGAEAGAGIETIGTSSNRASREVERATDRLTKEVQRTIVAFQSGGRTSREFYELLANQKGVNVEALKPLLDQLDLAKAKQLAATEALLKGGNSMSAYGMTAKQTAAALRQVPAQLTDIVVSLQGGQAPLTVLLQQGGQLRDIFGGIAPAARALGSTLMGLVNPYTLLAAGVGALAAGYYYGSKESDAYAKALIMTGNASGATLGQIDKMAESMSKVAGSQGEAAAALVEFANNGNIAAQNMERFALVAVKANRLAGVSVSETVKAFAELAKDPVDASIKLNETTRFLTTSLYQQIKALQDQGKMAEAAALAQGAYASDMEGKMQKLQDRLGYVEKAWQAAGDMAKSAWNKFLDVGRETTPEKKLEELQSLLDKLNGDRANLTVGDRSRIQDLGGPDGVKQAIENQKETNKLLAQSTTLEAERKAQAQARIVFDKEGEKYLDNRVRLTRALAVAEAQAKAAGASPEELKQRLANVREDFAKKMDPEALSGMKRDIENIKEYWAELTNNYVNAGKIMEATRAAGLLDEREYFEARREMMRLMGDAQIAALEEENRRLEKQKKVLSRKDALDVDKQILANERQIGKARQEMTAGQVVLDIQEVAALKAKEAALVAARQAAQDYLTVQERQQTRDLQAMGQGNRQRQFNTGLNQIEDRYAAQKLELDNQRALLELQGKFGADERKNYDERLAILKEFQGKAVTSYKNYYDNLRAQERDWSLGAKEALQNYYDEAFNAYANSNKVFQNALGGMEDALVKFVTTGKLSFKELANSIVADISRIIIKQQISNALGLGGGSGGSLLGNVFGALMGGATGGGTPSASGVDYSLGGGSSGLGIKVRASGGPVASGGLYRVNERGPELLSVGGKQYLMMGNTAGNVTPNSGLQGGGNTINLTVNQSFAAGTSRATTLQAAADARRQLEHSARNL